MASGHLRYENRIGWATSYLNRADALERPVRGQDMITETGRKLLTDHPEGITERGLRAVAEDADSSYLWFGLKSQSPMDSVGTENGNAARSDLDPVEQIENGIARIHIELADNVLGVRQQMLIDSRAGYRFSTSSSRPTRPERLYESPYMDRRSSCC